MAPSNSPTNGFKSDQSSAFSSLFSRLPANTTSDAIAAVKASPDEASLWYALGRVLALKGEKEKARDCFTRAVALDQSIKNRPGLRRPSGPSDLPDWL